MVLLDVSGIHATSIVHDEGCDDDHRRYAGRNPIGMVSAFWISSTQSDAAGFLGTGIM